MKETTIKVEKTVKYVTKEELVAIGYHECYDGDIGKGDGVAKNEDVKQRIDEAEKELRELFNDLIYEHNDNEGQYQLNNLASGFNTLLKYAREWQKNGEH